jgi:Fis family transcriptional regulator, factor for inversion stimulation protein
MAVTEVNPAETEINSARTAISKSMQTHNIRECMQCALSNYFTELDEQEPNQLYDMVLAEVEIPLLEAVLRYTKGNQSKAAIFLGISRTTLRTKLKRYHLN